MPEPSIPNPHDCFFREAFTRKEVARGFFREYLPPTLVRQLNLDSLRITKDSFIEKQLQEHFSDILYTVHYRDRPVYIYLLLEHKESPLALGRLATPGLPASNLGALSQTKPESE